MLGFYIEGMDTHTIPTVALSKSNVKRDKVVLDENFNIKEQEAAKQIAVGCGDCGLNTLEWEDEEIPLTDIYF